MSDVAKPAYWVDGEPGLQPVSTPASRLEADIGHVGRAYDAVHKAVWSVNHTAVSAHLGEALKIVETCLDRLAQDQDALRGKGTR